MLNTLKSVFNRKKNKGVGINDPIGTDNVISDNSLENLIRKKEIKYYMYSDFNNIRESRENGENIVRADLKDEFFILKSFNNDDTTIHNVVRELKLHRKFGHENILQFHGITMMETETVPDIVQNKYVLVLEYINGGTLGSYLNRYINELNELNWNDKYRLALQLASAVSYLHDKGISHNNMHENNIYVHQKNIKLADFGLLSKVSSSINTLYLFKMVPYIDPKSFEDNNYDLNKKSDVYSIGMLLWQISSGRKPFHSESYNLKLASTIIRGRREDATFGTPFGYSKLYEECWNSEPDERPDMQKVVSTLNELKSSNTLQEDYATALIKNFMKNQSVNIIPFNDLKDPVFLCEGGFGDINKAIWTRTNKYVVYKKIINTNDIEYNALDAFIHELKIHLHLVSIYSDRIVRYLGISQDGKDYLLVTEYADGGDLRNYLKNNFKNLTWHDKKKLAYQIADGLNYLHNENVLHRDLHSKNIVIHETNAKIIDFGISKIQGQKSEAYMRDRGIIAYMEPKRIFNSNFQCEKSSDIYSFGVLMWEISSGYPPFKNNSFSESDLASLCMSIKNGAREKLIPGTPKEYEKLYKMCWDQEPKQRPIASVILDIFAKMGFGNAINIENISDEENSKSTIDLQGDLFIKT
ncbi:kinase-like protein [Rhizophagus irregularis]|uniref:Kinase-like protein n=1 Tax=Rhizophagus irregularis TaxID=588596 RepID=A0A2N0Q3K9_9GLOM|nr:kinase-like protein [Rhizophagus irregularis]